MKRFGWECEILAVKPHYLSTPIDNWLCGSLPEDVPIHHSNALPVGFRFLPGLGAVDLRAFWAMEKLGSRLISTRSFDLVYFSTTAFILTGLGPRWFKKFKVPYIVDYQDPWITDYYSKNSLRPPGGRLKYEAMQLLGKRVEERVIRDCSGITAVSDEFPRELRQRYPAAEKTPVWVAPFPATSTDFARVNDDACPNGIFSPQDGLFHWMYAGVIAPGMYRALRAFFNAVKIACSEQDLLAKRLRVHFVGTSYAPSGTAVAQAVPLANEFGVGHLIDELPDRIPYSQALRCLRDADALLLFGSDEPAYAASKLMPYLVTRKPTLAVLRECCAADQRLRELAGATAVRYKPECSLEKITEGLMATWFRGNQFATTVGLNETAFYGFSDVGQAESLTQFFESVVASQNRH